MNSYQHLTRAFVIIAVLALCGVALRANLVPDTFGKWGAYRASHIDEERARLPLISDDESCLNCHETQWNMAGGKHANVPCMDCHFLDGEHARPLQGDQSLNEFALRQSRKNSEMVFKSLLAVMSQGWNQDDIERLSQMLSQSEVGMRVRVHRGEPVIRQFGEASPKRRAPKGDEDIRKALSLGEESLKIEGEKDAEVVRYLYPLKVEEECLACHTKARLGEVNGVIEVLYPLARMKLKMYQKLADMPVDRSREACQMCHRYLNSRPEKHPQVKDFDEHIQKGWKTNMGPVDLGAPCLRCHKAHIPSIIKRRDNA
jgi:hypothetical protein